jgi:hypothetical protein
LDKSSEWKFEIILNDDSCKRDRYFMSKNFVKNKFVKEKSEEEIWRKKDHFKFYQLMVGE